METAVPAPAAQPPFSAGTVISRSVSVWAENVVAFSAVLLVLHTPNLVLSLLAGPGPGALSPTTFALLNGVNGILSGLVSFVGTGALTYGVLQSLRGTRVGAGGLLGFGFRKLWPVLVVSFGAGIRIFLWSLLFLVPGILAACRYFVAVAAEVAEPQLGPGEAISRSSTLTKGHRGAIFVTMFVFWIVSVATGVLVGVVGLRAGVIPFSLATALTWLVTTIVGGLWATACGVAYHDLRVEKEGADTAQLAAVFE